MCAATIRPIAGAAPTVADQPERLGGAPLHERIRVGQRAGERRHGRPDRRSGRARTPPSAGLRARDRFSSAASGDTPSARPTRPTASAARRRTAASASPSNRTRSGGGGAAGSATPRRASARRHHDGKRRRVAQRPLSPRGGGSTPASLRRWSGRRRAAARWRRRRRKGTVEGDDGCGPMRCMLPPIVRPAAGKVNMRYTRGRLGPPLHRHRGPAWRREDGARRAAGRPLRRHGGARGRRRTRSSRTSTPIGPARRSRPSCSSCSTATASS